MSRWSRYGGNAHGERGMYGFEVAIVHAPYIYKEPASCDVVCYASRLSQALSSFNKD
jgi:hypothetical protein